MGVDLTIRAATHDDLDGIADLQPQGLARHLDVRPRAAVAHLLRRQAGQLPAGDHLLVAVDPAETGDGVIGYAYSSSYRSRPAYRRTRENLIYLARAARGRGIGTVL